MTIILYFISSKYFGKETLSWVCILGASPFAILGFFKYNGMPAEKVIMCYIKSNFLVPRKMIFKPKNYYYELTKDYIENKEREGFSENIKKSI